MKKFVLFAFTLFFFAEKNQAQMIEKVIEVRNNAFLQHLIDVKEYVYPIRVTGNTFLHSNTPSFIDREQVILKTPKNLYVQYWGTGFLFRLTSVNDSILTFTRIDNTENLNYNQGAYHFTAGEDIFNFGGYGFWKSNGHLRVYNAAINEWGIVPTSEEAIPALSPNNPSWFDPLTSSLYLPYQTVINVGLLERTFASGKIINDSKVLDIKTGIWKNTGKVSEDYIEMIKKCQARFNYNKGLIILWNEDLYLINYLENSIYKLRNNSVAQNVLHMAGQGNMVYYSNGTLRRFNLYSKITDSIQINLADFKRTSMRITERDPIVYYFTLALIICSAILIYIFKKRSRNSIRKTNPFPSEEKPFTISFSGTEKTLINLLISKSTKNRTISIEEINYVLGVKDKNTGLQKKVRSDTFNDINEKFRFLTQRDQVLIQSKRSEEDKRYFEYYINQENIHILQQFI